MHACGMQFVTTGNRQFIYVILPTPLALQAAKIAYTYFVFLCQLNCVYQNNLYEKSNLIFV